eukprot:s939_g21.t1
MLWKLHIVEKHCQVKAFPGFLNDDLSKCEGVATFVNLHCIFRGGAGGSATTARKRNVKEILQQLQQILESCEEEEQKEPSPMSLLNTLGDLVQKWSKALPTQSEILLQLRTLISEYEKKDVGHAAHKSPVMDRTSVVKQSFYADFAASHRSSSIRSPVGESSKGKGKQNGGKNSGKGAGLPLDGLPIFDLRRIFPSKEISSWQVVLQTLEQGNDPVGSVVVCDSVYRMAELQALASVHAIQKDLVLVAKESDDSVTVDGSKVEFLPVVGHAAVLKARVACLSGKVPSLSGSAPLDVDATDMVPTEADLVTLRFTVVLDLLEKAQQDLILRHPQFCLKLMGCKENEVKTTGWQRHSGLVVGYGKFHADKIQNVLKLSGQSGVFATRLKQDVVSLPAVTWFAPEQGESTMQYFSRVAEAGKEKDVPLAHRCGGGSWLGILVKDTETRCHAWCAFGIPTSWGPLSVRSWLEKLKWHVETTPTPPRGRGKPWCFQGYETTKPTDEEFTYAVAIGGNEHPKHVSIRRWQKQRKITVTERLTGPKWWGVEMLQPDDPIEVDCEESKTVSLTNDVAATQLDSQDEEVKSGEDKKKKGMESQTSPPKKRTKVVAEKETKVASVFDGMVGPGRTTVRDLKGDGDCGWRTLAYMIAQQNAKWNGDVKKILGNIETRAKSCQAKVTTHLIKKEVGWKTTWVADPLATEVTEGGPPPTSVAEFEKALVRPKRWICGLGLQACALAQKVNVCVWGLTDGMWDRLAVFRGPGDYTNLPTIPVVFFQSHYYALDKINSKEPFPEEWIEKEGRVLLFSGVNDVDISCSPLFRGGGGNELADEDINLIAAAGFLTPLRKKKSAFENGDQVESKLKSCSSRVSKLVKSCSSNCDSDEDWLRTCSPLSQARVLKVRKHNVFSKKKDAGITSPKVVAQQIKNGEKVRWECPICSHQITVGRGDSLKVVSHMRNVHIAQYKKAVENNRFYGRGGQKGVSGFGIRGLLDPIPFESFEGRENEADFVCPYCSYGYAGKYSRRQVQLSKLHHLKQECKHKPKGKGKKLTLKQYYHDTLRKNCKVVFRHALIKRGKRCAEVAQQKAKGRGHNPTCFAIKWPFQSKKEPLMHICKDCFAFNGTRGWLKACRGKAPDLTAPSVGFWRKYSDLNTFEYMAGQLDLEKDRKDAICKTL